MAEMTSSVIVDLCKRNGGYRQPHLNDQLYLQCRGFRQIQNLEPYINCKALWLDQNAISEVENLSHFKDLATLFLQDNSIRRLNARSFEGLQNLRILNLSNNHLSRLHGLESVPLLETLEISKNRFESLESIRNIFVCKKLSSVDASYNMIDRIGNPDADERDHQQQQENGGANQEDEEEKDKGDGGDCPDNAEKDRNFINTDNAEKLVAFWQGLPELGVLYIHGNELPRRCKFYRKRMICGLPQLMYLDERPIFPDERRTTEAWGRGGNEAEEAERNAIRDEKVAEMEKNVKSLIDLKFQKKEVREIAEKERLLKMEEEKAWRNAMQVTWACERTEMDHSEFEQRAFLDGEETRVFDQWFGPAAVKHSLDYYKAAETRRRLEEEVQRELDLEEKRIEQEMQKKRDQMRGRHEEMKKAIDMFKNDDAAALMMSLSKEEVLERKRMIQEQEEREVNEQAAAQMREESNKAFYSALKPKSETEVMNDLFDGGNDQQEQQEQERSGAAASSSSSSKKPTSKVSPCSPSSSLLPSAVQMLTQSSMKLDQEVQEEEEKLKQQQQQQATNTTKKNKGSTTHWDTFLAMENKSKRRF